jgi:hypothetical protein
MPLLGFHPSTSSVFGATLRIYENAGAKRRFRKPRDLPRAACLAWHHCAAKSISAHVLPLRSGKTTGEGKTVGDTCRQLKVTSRNGWRDLAILQEHIAKDDLVAWG